MRLEEYAKYDGVGLASLVKNKEVTTDELTHLALNGIDKVNPKLNALAQLIPSKHKKTHVQKGPFEGVPFLIKEYPLHASNVRVRMGSEMTGEGIKPPMNSSLMNRFQQAGLNTIGTSHIPEFALSGSTESIRFGYTRNPWATSRTPGGSSGGAAALVAAGVLPMAHGNDSGGSLRIPASCSGLIGLKPTRGRVPSGPFVSEPFFGLECEFALTKTVRDTAVLLDAVSGPDKGAYSWAERPLESYSATYSKPTSNLKIAVMKTPFNGATVHQEILEELTGTIKLCEQLNHEIVEDSPRIDIEKLGESSFRFCMVSMYRVIDRIAKTLKVEPSEKNLGPVAYSSYQYGKQITVDELMEAQVIQNEVSRIVGQFFDDYDVLLSPSLAELPVHVNELSSITPDLDLFEWFRRLDAFVAFQELFNMTGQPAISLPLGWSKEGLPIGMQFVGRYADETTLLQLANQLEHVKPWRNQKPPVHVTMPE